MTQLIFHYPESNISTSRIFSLIFTFQQRPTKISGDILFVLSIVITVILSLLEESKAYPSVKKNENIFFTCTHTLRIMTGNGLRNALFDGGQIANYGITMEFFSAAIQDFFGNIMYTEKKIKNVFKMIDESGKRYVNKEEFLDYCDVFSLKTLESSNSVDAELGARSKILWIADSKTNRQPNK